MKRYEGLFILDTAGKEEGIKDVIDKISADIVAAGGKVETVQKMEKKPFMRVANKKHNAGYYVNVIFESQPATIDQLKHRFAMSEDVFRVLFTRAPAPKPASA
ncbi:Ribosomal protein S6 [Verrucomicrobia bacterium]|nr:Ribosomal protein S6 [Verrucomicrobiota bacterium]